MNGFILFVISLLPLGGLLPNGLPLTHDGPDHVARIANFFQNLSEGVIVPRWAGNLNWGYGHPILMFLYPMSSYLGSFFHAMGFSFVDATKLVFALAFTASILTMYLWVQTAFGKRAGIIAAILYGFAPYRFVDVYVRGAIGEHVAFIFPPLILFFLYKLSQPGTRNQEPLHSVGLSISMACLILSHNAIAIMFLPIIALYMVYLFFTKAKGSPYYIRNTLYFILLGFGLSSFFWIPALFEGKYTLRDIVTQGEFGNRFVPWTWFFYSPWNYGQGNEFTKTIGIGWIGILTTLTLIWKTKEKSMRILLATTLVVFFGSLFMMTSPSLVIWNNIPLFQKFQFPWRFLSLSIFLSSFLGGISIASLVEREHTSKKVIGNYVVVLFCIISVFITIQMWKPKEYRVKPELFYTGIYDSTTDTGESSPIWSVRFMEHRPSGLMEIVFGSGSITNGTRTTTIHEYTIHANDSMRLVENTLYFPGWKVYVDGMLTGVQYQDPTYRGLMTFEVKEGQHTVRIVFEETKLRYVANLISVMSIGLLCVTGLCMYLWKRK